jgi:hypothetical protein
MSAIKSWLHECRTSNHHNECRPANFVPRRLVSVGLEGTPIRLVEGRTITDRMGYITLSYCWGQSLQIKTTKETLVQYSEEIPAKLLPKTFIDAINVARALGIPRIWIDALCIVQDDEDEWQGEAANMCDIYRGSELTITAADSADSSEGCFPLGDDEAAKEDLFSPSRTSSHDGQERLFRVFHNDVRHKTLSSTAVARRGWILQEQLLSTRTVSCMRSEVHWQCQSQFKTETALEFEPDEVFAIAKHIRTPVIVSNHRRSAKLHRATWQLIAENYSKREFTHASDRVPALAGLTSYFVAILNDTPILGLWKDSFAMDLAWLRVSKDPTVSARLKLPSWTWLSSPGSVSYSIWEQGFPLLRNPTRLFVPRVELLDWDIQWSGVPHTSAVREAQVSVEGLVREIKITPSAEGNVFNPPYFGVFGENSQPSDPSKNPWRCCGQLDASPVDEEATYLCLLILSALKTETYKRSDEVFLFLEPVCLEDGTRYKRLGLGRIWGDSPVFEPGMAKTLVLV